MMANDMIVGITRSAAISQACKKKIIDRKGFWTRAADQLKSVRKEVIGVAATIFTPKRSIRMDEITNKSDGAIKGFLNVLRWLNLVKLG